MYGNTQKQLFVAVLQKRCYQKFPKIHRKTPVLESRFKNIIFAGQFRTTASALHWPTSILHFCVFYVGLRIKVGNPVISIQRCIKETAKDLWWSFLAKIVNWKKLLIIFTKNSIIDVWQGPKYFTCINW